MGKKVIYLPSCHSTNDVASDLIKKGGIYEGTIVITDNQTAGKGQRGNSWLSAPNSNLTFSIVLKPNFLNAVDQFNLNMFISLGILNYLSTESHGFKIKWPNDIYFKNKKIGGILIQNTIKNNKIEDCIVGIGLNINQINFELPSPTSLKLITGNDYNLESVLHNLCHSLEIEYLKLKTGKIDALKSSYMEKLLGLNEERLFKSNHEFRGTITGISKTGRLQIQTLYEVREFDFKEVEFL